MAIERHERSRLAAELTASWQTAARTLQERESLRAELASARPALQVRQAEANRSHPHDGRSNPERLFGWRL